MSDKELLSLAAKAVNGGAWHPLTHSAPWNPLSSFSQAKELRHALCLSTGFDNRFSELGPCAYATYQTGPESCSSIMQNIEDAGGKKAALRRAIVRAAAEIGKQMTEPSK